jgi:hypothetical protein
VTLTDVTLTLHPLAPSTWILFRLDPVVSLLNSILWAA